jgi:hypothetical protein
MNTGIILIHTNNKEDTHNNDGLLITIISSTCFGQLFCPKHVELIIIINKQLLLHLVGCLPYYL